MAYCNSQRALPVSRLTARSVRYGQRVTPAARHMRLRTALHTPSRNGASFNVRWKCAASASKSSGVAAIAVDEMGR